MGCGSSTPVEKNAADTRTAAETPAGDKPSVIVLGASGYVGKSTLSSLVERHGSKLKIAAGVRNPEKFGETFNVDVVKADMGGDKDELAEVLKAYDRIFVVVPGSENRTELASNAIEACKAAGMKFILMLSVLTAPEEETIFGKQFAPVEAKMKEDVGEGGAVIRLPIFMDNFYAQAPSIKESGTFYEPRDPTKPHTPVTTADIGKAAADILAEPEKHAGKTYKLVMPPFNMNDVAAAFTKTLGKEVTVTTVPYQSSKEAFMGLGYPEWQVDGIMELYKMCDEEKPIINEADITDIETITGEKAMTMEEWVEANKAGFQWEIYNRTLTRRIFLHQSCFVEVERCIHVLA